MSWGHTRPGKWWGFASADWPWTFEIGAACSWGLAPPKVSSLPWFRWCLRTALVIARCARGSALLYLGTGSWTGPNRRGRPETWRLRKRWRTRATRCPACLMVLYLGFSSWIVCLGGGSPSLWLRRLLTGISAALVFSIDNSFLGSCSPRRALWRTRSLAEAWSRSR